MYYRLRFYLHYQTQFGQNIFLLGNIPVAGNNNPKQAIQLHWLPGNWWYADINLPQEETIEFQYHYLVRELEQTITEGAFRKISIRAGAPYDQVFIDTWNDAANLENNWSTAPFTRVFFPHKATVVPGQLTATHIFKVKAPLLEQHQTVCLLGSSPQLGNWDATHPILLQYTADECFTAVVDLRKVATPLPYKYGIWDMKAQRFLEFENGDNRYVHFDAQPGRQVTMQDGFVRRNYQPWKGTGVAVPVFSLRSVAGLGTGEFADIPLLAQWAATQKMHLIQLLPINDTTATHTWRDSYPYAAVSSYALHPLYIRLQDVGHLPDAHPLQQELPLLRQRLNDNDKVDYEAVMDFKLKYLHALYEQQDYQLETTGYWQWFAANEHWLLPYAAFCYLRDKYQSPDFSHWSDFRHYQFRAVNAMIMEDVVAAESVRFHFFVQYHLHLQLEAAVTKSRALGIALKGDIPIGVGRCSVETWTHPDLFHMDMQAGAPPDSFTTEGQNWGFPTYNWSRMAEDGYEWWRQRFQHMAQYFDAFRIDHILGFFRIWQMPMDAVQGVLGFFHPAVPVSREELIYMDIGFEEERFCEPYITDELLDSTFGNYAGIIKDTYMIRLTNGRYAMQSAFNTQRKVQQQELPAGMKLALYHLLADVIFIREKKDGKVMYHPRIDFMSTSSFADFPADIKVRLADLHQQYFYGRHEHRWRKEALQKLPYISKATDMLICGEDLGMVPACVPAVMEQLGILSLEIQHMPKHPQDNFQSLQSSPYRSVVTPSTHDMSTLQGWWQEDPARTQQYWEEVLKQSGKAPKDCSPDIIQEIVDLHLQSPAMWRIFQIQELLAMEGLQTVINPEEERINIPAVPVHYWRYRIKTNLEDILKINSEVNGTASISI
ncbi:MAG: 4-alpha-glucanotransferase [Chitinophaga sp.]|uniref:4-alpha-glucanotransferase n=1 Tax=Chitinophaga sp. TaxID=1869181 RepID=UPI0025C54EEF|nr:4-alpha-glucanotransferase [Chitinophaga sp.]MBV8253221.1 4-alpha-glucanotransferase [Chitinophaga sp.]